LIGWFTWLVGWLGDNAKSDVKLLFPGHQTSWVSDWVCSFSSWASSTMQVANKTKFGTKVA